MRGGELIDRPPLPKSTLKSQVVRAPAAWRSDDFCPYSWNEIPAPILRSRLDSAGVGGYRSSVIKEGTPRDFPIVDRI
jgi:hypothetical protein